MELEPFPAPFSVLLERFLTQPPARLLSDIDPDIGQDLADTAVFLHQVNHTKNSQTLHRILCALAPPQVVNYMANFVLQHPPSVSPHLPVEWAQPEPEDLQA